MTQTMVKCPKCKKPALFSEKNPYRPFCSERCQTLDLGGWAAESYAVPGEAINPGIEVNQNSIENSDVGFEVPSHHLN